MTRWWWATLWLARRRRVFCSRNSKDLRGGYSRCRYTCVYITWKVFRFRVSRLLRSQVLETGRPEICEESMVLVTWLHMGFPRSGEMFPVSCLSLGMSCYSWGNLLGRHSSLSRIDPTGFCLTYYHINILLLVCRLLGCFFANCFRGISWIIYLWMSPTLRDLKSIFGFDQKRNIFGKSFGMLFRGNLPTLVSGLSGCLFSHVSLELLYSIYWFFSQIPGFIAGWPSVAVSVISHLSSLTKCHVYLLTCQCHAVCKRRLQIIRSLQHVMTPGSFPALHPMLG